MSARVTSHFVTVGKRRVHYTRAGSGPAVCLFHPSPCSAARMRMQQEVFATRFTALAFDTPGFGLSDRLDIAQPEIRDFADAMAETLTALGIGRAAVYGNHTGAAIAVEFAARHPDRCAMALADGYPAYSGAQAQDRLKRYLEPLVPKWDGSHLLWLWYRYREQHVFWPWHDHDLAHRADTDVPDADFLHQGVIDLLDAGDEYRIGYAAAFRGRGLGVLADLKVPVCFAVRPGDSLHRTKPAYDGTGAWLEETPRDPVSATVRERDLLSRHLGDVPPPAPACAPIAGRLVTDYANGPQGPLFMRSGGTARIGEPPLLCLHPLPGSTALVEGLMSELARDRRVLGFDLPGHGQSRPATGDAAQRWDGYCSALLGALGAHDAPVFDLLACGGSAVLAVELLRRAPARFRRVAFDGPPALDPVARAALLSVPAPSAAPEMDGTHLLRAWHHLRDQELWQPWHDRRRENARRTAPRIDPASLTLRAREMLKHPRGYAPTWEAVMSYPLRERMAELPDRPTLLLSAPDDIHAPCLDGAASAMSHAVVERPGSADERAAAIARFLAP